MVNSSRRRVDFLKGEIRLENLIICGVNLIENYPKDV
jgi:hypothetical protein